jgi:hypothetical protein
MQLPDLLTRPETHRLLNAVHQNAAVEQWLARQRAKLLAVDYYLVTFTLPAQPRAFAYANQRAVYDLLIKTAWQTLARFGWNDKPLRGQMGATAVLHTHSRALDYHPHVHVAVPAGALDTRHRLWRTKRGNFLFPDRSLAKVFRAKWFEAMNEQAWKVMAATPRRGDDQVNAAIPSPATSDRRKPEGPFGGNQPFFPETWRKRPQSIERFLRLARSDFNWPLYRACRGPFPERYLLYRVCQLARLVQL